MSQELAPGTNQTLEYLRDESRRPASMSEPFPPEVLEFQPRSRLKLNRKLFAKTLMTAPKGSSGAFSGTRYEFLKLALDDAHMLNNLTDMAENFARAIVPQDIVQALLMGYITALQKDGGGVRGIVAGESFRRLVSKALAKQYGPEIK